MLTGFLNCTYFSFILPLQLHFFSRFSVVSVANVPLFCCSLSSLSIVEYRSLPAASLRSIRTVDQSGQLVVVEDFHKDTLTWLLALDVSVAFNVIEQNFH